MRTSRLIGPALDWAVAKCRNTCVSGDDLIKLIKTLPDAYAFSTDWSQGGPIIEREEIGLRRYLNIAGEWVAKLPSGYGRGPTPLIAAMRCLVMSKMGDEVEVPEELK